MMTVTEKVAYLKGLVEGLDFDADKKETKVINAVLDVLEDLALAVSDLDDEMELVTDCLLYTSPSPRDRTRSRMPSSA